MFEPSLEITVLLETDTFFVAQVLGIAIFKEGTSDLRWQTMTPWVNRVTSGIFISVLNKQNSYMNLLHTSYKYTQPIMSESKKKNNRLFHLLFEILIMNSWQLD